MVLILESVITVCSWIVLISGVVCFLIKDDSSYYMKLGVSIIYTKKYPRILPAALFSMISAAIITHAYYNSLIQSNYMIIGLIFPMLVYLPSSIRLRRRMIKNNQNRIEQLLPDK